ncbi:hypothetical protein BDR06DRAFT_1062800 [Suillus hirtellus]|nr:hypothetical protein BDR06DRAFT_1062800 [Suillus hirtellus]
MNIGQLLHIYHYAPKVWTQFKSLEAKSHLEEQSFVEKGSPWFDASSPEEIQQLDNNAASSLTTEQARLPSFPVTSAMQYAVEFCITQLLKAITLGLLIVSFNWNGSLLGVKSSDVDHDVILANWNIFKQLHTIKKGSKLAQLLDFALVSSGAFYIPLLTSQFDITPSSWHTWCQAADQHISNSPNLALTARLGLVVLLLAGDSGGVLEVREAVVREGVENSVSDMKREQSVSEL